MVEAKESAVMIIDELMPSITCESVGNLSTDLEETDIETYLTDKSQQIPANCPIEVNHEFDTSKICYFIQVLVTILCTIVYIFIFKCFEQLACFC